MFQAQGTGGELVRVVGCCVEQHVVVVGLGLPGMAETLHRRADFLGRHVDMLNRVGVQTV